MERARAGSGTGLGLWSLLMAVLAVVAMPRSGLAQSTPTIDAAINDRVGVLRDPTSLESRLRDYHAEHGMQMAVLIVQTTGGEPIEDYALRVATQWRGGSADRDDGALFVLAIGDRRMRLEVGYGLEFAITDARAAQLLERAKPHLRSQNYDAAVREVIEGAIVLHQGGSLGPPQPPMPRDRRSGSLFLDVLIYGMAMVLGLIAGVKLERRRRKDEKGAFDAEVKEADQPEKAEVDWSKHLVIPFGAMVAAAVAFNQLDWALLAAYGIFFLVGWASEAWVESEAWRTGYWAVLVLGWGIVMFAYLGPSDGMHPLLLVLIHVGGATLFTFVIWMMSQGGGGGGSYSSYSSSSWSSSSFSSSSFSSGGFSGGGGSFGGGGASGSW